MKKGILILLGMFLMVSTTEAKEGEILSNKLINGTSYNTYNYYNNAVNFFENGIEFFVFTNGEFDFDTRFNSRGIRINSDYRGRITNVGNVFIRYDRRGNVTRIGSVLIRYSRGLLTNVGDLRVRYNSWNTPVFYGNVRNFYYNNGIRFNVSFGDVCDYNDAYFSRNDFGRNYAQFREDNNFYYYRARPNANIGKRSTILKRRKLVSTKRQNYVRNQTNSYRKAASTNRAISSRSTSNKNRNANQNRTTNRSSSSTSRNATTSRNLDTRRKATTFSNSDTRRKANTSSNSNSRRKATTDKKVDRKRKVNTRSKNSDNTRRRGSE